MSMSAVSFHIYGTDGKARAGVVTTKRGTIETPAVLLYTRRGCPLYLTPDTLEQVNPKWNGVQISAVQFMENPDPSVLRKYNKGGSNFLSLQPYVMLASNRDPSVYEYGARPSTENAAYVTIHCGGHLVTPSKYMDAIETLDPDLYITLCDEVTSDTKDKRLTSSLNRNAKWLQACLDEGVTRGVSAVPLAAVGGGASLKERAKAAVAVADKAVAGFALCGFGTGEAPSLRPSLLHAALGELPSGGLRHVSGLSDPLDLLDAVLEGVDLFDCAYVSTATAAGYALIFPIKQESRPELSPLGADPEIGSDSMKMNLWSPSYRLDKRPLLEGCTCFTCRRHNRAYLYHLLQVHEMLADVLLEQHNMQHYLQFMEQVRHAVRTGTFESYRAWFRALHSVPVPPMDGTNPLKRPPTDRLGHESEPVEKQLRVESAI